MRRRPPPIRLKRILKISRTKVLPLKRPRMRTSQKITSKIRRNNLRMKKRARMTMMMVGSITKI